MKTVTNDYSRQSALIIGISPRQTWLGRQDSNLGMAESKSAALPLGYAPTACVAANYRESAAAATKPPEAHHQRGSAAARASPARSAAPGSPKRAKHVAPLPLIRAIKAPGSAPRLASTTPISGTRPIAASVRSLRHRINIWASPTTSAGIGSNRPDSPKGPRRAANTARVGSL